MSTFGAMPTVAEGGALLPEFDTVTAPGATGSRKWVAPRSRAESDRAAQALITKGGFVEFSELRIRDLARCWQVLDSDADGLLQVEGELPRAIAAAGHAPSSMLVRHMEDSCPEEWRGRGVDFDTFLNALEAFASTQPIREASLRELAALAHEDRPSRAGASSPATSPSWQRARGTDFGQRFATEAAAASPRGQSGGRLPGSPAEALLPGFQLRRLLKLQLRTAVDGAPAPSLSDEDVDEILRRLEVQSESDRLRLADLVAALGAGFTHLLPELMERAYPHDVIRGLVSEGAAAVAEQEAKTSPPPPPPAAAGVAPPARHRLSKY